MKKLLWHKETILIIFLLLIAAFLRLYRIADYMTFLGDEGRDVLVVYDILHGKPTLLGPTASVGGFFLGPIYYYFMVPFLWLFNYNPVGPAVMVALFGIATVWLVYKVGSEFFGKTAGFIASLLYTVSPLVIAYSRSSWNPNLMPFFSLLTLYIVNKAAQTNNKSLFFITGFLLGIMMQLHYLAVFLGVIIGFYVAYIEWYTNRQKSISKAAIAIFNTYALIFFGFVLGWLPFLAFEVRHGFLNIQSIAKFIFSSGETGGSIRFFPVIQDVFFRLFGRLITTFPPPEQVFIKAHTDITIWYVATLALGIVSTLLFLIQWFKAIHQKQQRVFAYSLLFFWLFLGVVLFGFYKKSIYDYYFGFMFPVPFFLVGNLLSIFFYNNNKNFSIKAIGKIISVFIFASLLWVNLAGVPFRFPANKQLAQVEGIADFVLDKTDNKPFNFALIAAGNSDQGYRYFFTLVNKPPVAIETTQKDPNRTTVTNQLLVICETIPCGPLGNAAWEVAGFGRAEIVGEWNVSVVKVYKLIHYKGL